MNLIMAADAYTISSDFFASPSAKVRSTYNYTNRYSPKVAFPDVAFDDRMVFYGLTEFISRYLSTPINEVDIVNAAHFMESAHSFGGSLPFNKELWYRVLREYDGYLPIKIEALREGATFFPNEPVIQVTSLGEGFGELAVHVEAVLVGMVSIATARVTLERHMLEGIRVRVKKDNPDWTESQILGVAKFMVHDFGMRASSTLEESELLGMAHLLVFHGTDTFSAAYRARNVYGALSPTGTSILAAAHHSIQSWNNDSDGFYALHEAGRLCGVNICSYVGDCYNSANALADLVKRAIFDPLSTFVVRLDSGDYIANTLAICNAAKAKGLYKTREDGKLLPTNLRWINGDSMNPHKMYKVWEALDAAGFVPSAWGIFGIGGYLRNTPNRDTLSSAYKLSAIGLDNKPVCKLSEVQSKMSVPGPNYIQRYRNVMDHNKHPSVLLANKIITSFNSYHVYFNGKPTLDNNETFPVLQERTLCDFDHWKGINPVILSNQIVDFQKKTYDLHRG